MNEIAIPFLYPTVHFHLPGHISATDALLSKLEAFSNQDFTLLRHTTRVLISGTWYHAYDEIESRLGLENVISPAVRMLNTLITVCVSKMPNLRAFIWDSQIAPTQKLISKVALSARMEYLQLRVATDGSPTPYFHPTLKLGGFSKLRSLNIIDVKITSALQSVGNALYSTEQLSELAIWADEDVILSLDVIFSGWPGPRTLNLKSLDLRKFSNVGWSAPSLWQHISAACLRDLTLEVGSLLQPDDYNGFWEGAVAAGMRPTTLRTNLISEGLTNFICSCNGLEVFLLTACLLPRPLPPISIFLETIISEHFKSLRVLAIHAQGPDESEYLLDRKLLASLSSRCTKLEELGFKILEQNQADVHLIFQLPLLRALHIDFAGDLSFDMQELSHLKLRKLVAECLSNMAQHRLAYIAFDEGPVYAIQINPIRWHVRSNMIWYIRDTVIFREKMFDWIWSSPLRKAQSEK
ncbi:hypothetical protein GX50_07463 [[Emmonsia] crescens]|uniref:F-box domain-containing protein n=1 Tax=[Emmonsia] crescens TaxID=73230 RepID=A0A2B7Z9V6_9EURO|nr:hypothetical protein GX50_07463 [Emmonsia crescens]